MLSRDTGPMRSSCAQWCCGMCVKQSELDQAGGSVKECSTDALTFS